MMESSIFEMVYDVFVHLIVLRLTTFQMLNIPFLTLQNYLLSI